MAIIDITGQRFGRLVAVEYVGQSSGRKAMFRFKCDCGGEKVTSGKYARTGKAQSCGCLQRERTSAANKLHGEGGKTRLHRIWAAMLARCRQPNHKSWTYYGGRGVTVCDEWLDYATFRKWALAHGYADNLTIDRVNPDGIYEPANCRWLSIAEQQRNRRPRSR